MNTTQSLDSMRRELVAKRGPMPFLTHYGADGSRVELSGDTHANWVNKTAHFIVDELELDQGDQIDTKLPTHWITSVWAFAAWATGVALTDQNARVTVGGPTVDPAASDLVVACSLSPLGLPLTQLPGHSPTEELIDFNGEVRSFPDYFPAMQIDPAIVAGDFGPGRASHSQTIATAREIAADLNLPLGAHLLIVAKPQLEWHDYVQLTALALVCEGSVVIADDGLDMTMIASNERAVLLPN